jgi:hypothetical protein
MELTNTNRAVFYPNLCGIHRVKVLGSILLASNDHGTACYEQRSFIDKDTLASLQGGLELLEHCIEPQPPCTEITGQGEWSEQRVIGMLKEPLKVKWTSPTGISICLMLQCVLIIDKLPVPLHMSLKSIDMNQPGFNSQAFYEMINSNYGKESIEMKITSFPSQYHSHPYWNTKVHFIGMTENMNATNALLNSQLQPSSLLVCAICMSDKKISLCSACRAVGYCSVEHQKEHWPRHKKICCKN